MVFLLQGDENVSNLVLVQDNFGILEAYAKSWTSGALDRAASRGSLAYTLVLHHLSAFIFNSCTGDKLLLRNKLSRSLLLDFSLKQQHEVCKKFQQLNSSCILCLVRKSVQRVDCV